MAHLIDRLEQHQAVREVLHVQPVDVVQRPARPFGQQQAVELVVRLGVQQAAEDQGAENSRAEVVA
jgi:hypothetical protein